MSLVFTFTFNSFLVFIISDNFSMCFALVARIHLDYHGCSCSAVGDFRFSGRPLDLVIVDG